MSKYLLDTNIISSYLRGDETLKEKISGNIDLIATSIISYYEIISGLLSINANKRINEFEVFCEIVEIVNLDKSSITASCQIYSDLKNSGNLIDDIDILIAGIAISHNFIFVTDNTKHFKRIKNLKIENWK